MTFEVKATPEARRHIDRFPEKGRDAVLDTIFGSIADDPGRAGKPLRGELQGLSSARRGDFRVIYEIREEENVVVIHRAQHRKDVYRRR